MPLIEKRAIPGVTPNVYHQGYFEDQTGHYMVPPPRETPFTPLYNALIWFALASGVLIVVLGVAFAIREYVHTLRSRQKREYINENKLDYYWSSAAGRNEEVIVKDADLELKELQNGDNHWPRGAFPTYQRSQEPSETAEPLFTAAEPASNQIAHLDCIDKQTTGSGNTLFHYTGVQGEHGTHNGIHKYSVETLMRLRPSEMAPIPSPMLLPDEVAEEQGTHVIKRWITEPALKLVPTVFYSSWRAEKAMQEVQALLTNGPGTAAHDTASRKLMVMKLLAIGAPTRRLSNPNVFLPQYNALVDKLVTTGALFDLLQELAPKMTRALVDLIIGHAWCHWQYRRSRNKAVVAQFKDWRFAAPEVQPHHVLFRRLIDVELGLYATGREDIGAARAAENRLLTILNYMAVNSICNDYTGMIPVLAYATERTERVITQRALYGLLLATVTQHKDCCMREYLVEDTIYLKPLVQHGLWIENDKLVRQIAENVHLVIVAKYSLAMAWWQEIEGGKRFVPASGRDPELVTPEKPIESRIIARLAEEDNATIYEPSVPGSFTF